MSISGSNRDPKVKRVNLVRQVSDELRGAIMSGELCVGDKLPTEAQLTEMHSVSRTVIREAMASLKADGLVEARQGAGVFVVEPQESTINPFHSVDINKISSIIEMLELRAGLEIEAAGLAALRRSPAQEEAIIDAHRLILERLQAGVATADADFAFHIAVAEATNNPRYPELISFFGNEIIPRAVLRDGGETATDPNYISKIAVEHAEIAKAISEGDEGGARAAMRAHLKGALQRYRSVIRQDV